ncbi:MAG: N-6 DNA methylase [Planctomycetes bacterium]|nr:N-6 DNA methylase [Planctomycetota bacterium]MCL4729724.1 N-6 DNA methylase [Planctomycetota bacterium]
MLTATANLDAAWQAHDRAAAALAPGPGRVFTPRPLALRLAGAVLEPLADPPRLMDPACGCGALLLGAIEYAALRRPHWLEVWREDGLHGVDSDPAAARAARRALGTALGTNGTRIVVGDGLDLAADVCFDAVLANPPWVSFSGRQAARIPPARRRELARRFAAFAGWPSLHAAFAELAARLAEPHGRIGLLLPLGMSDLAGYAAARAALEKHHRLETVADLGEHAFAGVTEPSGLFVFGPGAGTTGPWNPVPDTQAARLARRFAPLPPECFGDIGIHSGNAADLLFSSRPSPRATAVRVGADVRPFALQKASLWLSGRPLPAGRYARVPDPAHMQHARILIRQTADRPIAARHQPAAAFRNSVLACFGAPGHDDDFLVALLNSDVVARIHRALHRDARQRTFPQMKVSHLRALPVPGPEIGPAYGEIARLSRRVQSGDATARLPLEAAILRVFES